MTNTKTERAGAGVNEKTTMYCNLFCHFDFVDISFSGWRHRTTTKRQITMGHTIITSTMTGAKKACQHFRLMIYIQIHWYGGNKEMPTKTMLLQITITRLSMKRMHDNGNDNTNTRSCSSCSLSKRAHTNRKRETDQMTDRIFNTINALWYMNPVRHILCDACNHLYLLFYTFFEYFFIALFICAPFIIAFGPVEKSPNNQTHRVRCVTVYWEWRPKETE